jgi:hypothetical protein
MTALAKDEFMKPFRLIKGDYEAFYSGIYRLRAELLTSRPYRTFVLDKSKDGRPGWGWRRAGQILRQLAAVHHAQIGP